MRGYILFAALSLGLAQVDNATAQCPCTSGQCGAMSCGTPQGCPCAPARPTCELECVKKLPDGRAVFFAMVDGRPYVEVARGCEHVKVGSRHKLVDEAPARSSSSQLPTPESQDALEIVNTYRATRGLRPFQRCPGLTRGAIACVQYRVANRIHGHTNDFAFVPSGYVASATGAEGGYNGTNNWPVNGRWGTCCMDDTNVTYAGAAWAAGDDHHQYMSLFVR